METEQAFRSHMKNVMRVIIIENVIENQVSYTKRPIPFCTRKSYGTKKERLKNSD